MKLKLNELAGLSLKLATMKENKALETLWNYIEDNTEYPDWLSDWNDDDHSIHDTLTVKSTYVAAKELEQIADNLSSPELEQLTDMLYDAADIWSIKHQIQVNDNGDIVYCGWIGDNGESWVELDLDTGEVIDPCKPEKSYEPNANRLYWKN